LAEVILLGSSASVPDAEHDNVYLVVHSPGEAVLVDCGGSPLWKLLRAGVKWDDLQAVVLTHEHADHMYGLPMLIQGLWLWHRKAPLTLYGPEATLQVAQKLLALFGQAEWLGCFPLRYQPVDERGPSLVYHGRGFAIETRPVRHMIPTVAVRVQSPGGRSLVYSSDTAPTLKLATWARGVDILIHEATGNYAGHSTAAQAGEVAAVASAKRLVLVHYSPRKINPETLLIEAAKTFAGPVELGYDGERFEL